MAGECGLALDTIDRLAGLLDITLTIPTKREFAQLASNPGGQLRLRFIDNVFSEIVQPPIGKTFSEWEDEERERLRKLRGPKTTLSHYTCDILIERPTDSAGLRKRRATIPVELFQKFGPKATA